MRLRLIAPADLSPEQRPVYEDMRTGIEKNFQGFSTIAKGGALMGPWNPWLHEPKFGKPIWELTKALSFSPSLPKPVREVAILVTGAKFRAAYEIYAHVMLAERRGLSDEKLATIVAGQRPNDLARDEAIAYDVASALGRSRRAVRADLLPSSPGIRRTWRRRAHLSCRPLLPRLGHVEWL